MSTAYLVVIPTGTPQAYVQDVVGWLRNVARFDVEPYHPAVAPFPSPTGAFNPPVMAPAPAMAPAVTAPAFLSNVAPMRRGGGNSGYDKETRLRWWQAKKPGVCVYTGTPIALGDWCANVGSDSIPRFTSIVGRPAHLAEMAKANGTQPQPPATLPAWAATTPAPRKGRSKS